MSDLNEQREVIKKLVQAFERIEDLVIEACRDIIRDGYRIPITEDDLRVLKASRDVYRNSDYDVGDMVQYLKSIRDRTNIWDLGVRSSGIWLVLRKVGWKYWLAQIQIYGEEAWKLAVPASNVLASNDGSDTVNAMITKFAALDTVLDVAFEEIRPGTHRERFSDELRDTVFALIDWSTSSGGPYQPLPTPSELDRLKAEVRRRRQRQIVEDDKVRDATINSLLVDTANVALNASPRKWNPTITALVSIFTIIAIVPGYKAWQCSPHKPGSTTDADFWFLVQNSMMQVLGLLTILFPLMSSPRLPTQAWFWTWGFVCTGFICAVVALPVYVFCPTEWSSAIAFLGSCAQVFVILQAMFTVDQPVLKSNRDE